MPSQAKALTHREIQVLERLRLGETSKEIAARLGLSPRTADFHIANILGKTGCCSRIRLIAILGGASASEERSAVASGER